MAMPIVLHYHGQTLRLLGQTPGLCPEALEIIARFEEEHGQLPKAVKEWYSLKDAVEMLAQSDGACGPVSLVRLLDEIADSSVKAQDNRPQISFYGPWQVNTGYEADLILNGSGDPPVSIDPDGRQQSFSRYVLDLAWWKATFDGVPGLLVQGKQTGDYLAECGPDHLAFLTSHFEELPREPHPFLTDAFDQPDLRGYRFFRGQGRVAISTKGDATNANCPALYDLSASTEEVLWDLYGFLWPCHNALVRLCPVKPQERGEMTSRFLARFPSVDVQN